MDQDTKTRRMANGKADMRKRIIWQLEVGAYAFRCVRSKNEKSNKLQYREPSGWKSIRGETTPLEALIKVLGSLQNTGVLK
jgi:hypothetical protein